MSFPACAEHVIPEWMDHAIPEAIQKRYRPIRCGTDEIPVRQPFVRDEEVAGMDTVEACRRGCSVWS